MEEKKSNNIVPNDDDKKKMKIIKDDQIPKPKKKRGAMHLLRVAFYMLRRKSKTSMHVDLASRVLGSMRPLHLHANDDQPLKDIKSAAAPPPLIEQTAAINEDVFTPPALKSIASSSSMDSLSQYASATNLQELDTCDEEEEEDWGDEMIDAKAEEFINQFYEQIRIQNFQ